MKTDLTMQQLAGRLIQTKTGREDSLVDPRSLRYHEADNGQPTIVVPGRPAYPMTSYAHNQLVQWAGIPAQYVDSMRKDAPGLLEQNVNRWLQEKAQPRMLRMLGGQVRAWLSNAYRRIDNPEVAEVVLPLLRDHGCELRSASITETKMYIKVVTDEIQTEIKSLRQNDFVRGGLVISNSDVGAGMLKISPWAEFLWCTNGMVREHRGMQVRHVGRKQTLDVEDAVILSEDTMKLEDAAMISRIEDTIKAALDRKLFEEDMRRVQGLTERPLEGDPIKAVEVLGEVCSLTQGEQRNVLMHFFHGPDKSAYGLVNAITRSAEDVESYDRATELETLGGRLSLDEKMDWSKILTAA